MMLFFVVLSFGVAAALAALFAAERVQARWAAAADRYVGRMSDTCTEMLVTVEPILMRRALLATTLGGMLIGWWAGTIFWQQAILAVCGCCVGYCAPGLAVRGWQRRRRQKLDEQFARVLALMANGLQAGLSLPQSIELAVRESPRPIADELTLVVKELRLGAPFDHALRVLSRRIASEDVRMAVDAILTLKETGGDLVSSFDVISRTIAERWKVEGRIRVLTAEAMLQGIVMCLIPPVMLVVFALMDPASVAPLVAHPLGWALFAIVGTLTALGFLLMRKVARVEV